MNVIEFPIFSKNNRVKKNQAIKYYFSKDKNSYLEIAPPIDDTIPNEFDERIFIALIKVMKSKGYEKTFYCSASEIVDSLNLGAEGTKRATQYKIKGSIIKLSKTIYSFCNLFYIGSLKNKVDDLINTALISSRIITSKEAKETEKCYFSDKRIKEIYRITISDDIYNNLVNKGYLVFDADELLDIKDSVIRSLYTQITKWRNTSLYLKRPAIFIAKKIPLSWKGTMIFKSVNKIKDSLEYLKNKGLISDYNIIKGKRVENTEFEIFFDKEHNKYKQKLFYEESTEYNNIIHFFEERENIENKKMDIVNLEESILHIIKIFGEKEKILKSLPEIIKESLENYDFDYVKYSAEYTMINAKVNIVKYFKDTLKYNWAEEYINNKRIKESKKNIKEIEQVVCYQEVKETFKYKYTWEDFLKIEKELQGEIEAVAYEEFLIESGSENNKIMKGIFEKSKKPLILKVMEKYENEINIKDTSEEIKDNLSENVNVEKEYLNILHFIGEVIEKISRKGILFDKIKIESINMLLGILGKYEDTFMKLEWNEIERKGRIINRVGGR